MTSVMPLQPIHSNCRPALAAGKRAPGDPSPQTPAGGAHHSNTPSRSSLWQPWASLIFARDIEGKRIKVHETRSFAPHSKVKRGSQILIHAAKTAKGYDTMSSELHEICLDIWGCSYNHTLPHGALIGKVTLADWMPTDTLFGTIPSSTPVDSDDFFAGDWSLGRWAWRLDNPVEFRAVQPLKGQQGFWVVDDLHPQLEAA